MIAIIQAGGKGTRLAALTENRIPKPLIKMNGVPLLEQQILVLKKEGISEFIIVTGFLGEQIEEYFQNGSALGVRITYFRETEPLGSAGALYYLKDRISDDFLLIFGDLVFDIDVKKFYEFHKEKHSDVTLFTHPNSHPFDSDLVVTDDEEKVMQFISKKASRNFWYSNTVSSGIFIVSGGFADKFIHEGKADFVNDILMPMSDNTEVRIYSYRSPEYVKDAGTVERFRQVEADMLKDIPNMRNLKKRQKCVFLDRDGVINRYNGLIYREDQFELESCAIEAIRLLNNSGYLAIVCSNQPAPAKGKCTIDDIRNIHRKMETLLGEGGAYLDDIIFCPHHPQKGFPDENPALKIECNCRKPKTGMIDVMMQKYNIALENSYIIGDRTVDIQTGKNAMLKSILVKTGEAGEDCLYDAVPEHIAEDLLGAVKYIVKE